LVSQHLLVIGVDDTAASRELSHVLGLLGGIDDGYRDQFNFSAIAAFAGQLQVNAAVSGNTDQRHARLLSWSDHASGEG